MKNKLLLPKKKQKATINMRWQTCKDLPSFSTKLNSIPDTMCTWDNRKLSLSNLYALPHYFEVGKYKECYYISHLSTLEKRKRCYSLFTECRGTKRPSISPKIQRKHQLIKYIRNTMLKKASRVENWIWISACQKVELLALTRIFLQNILYIHKWILWVWI